MSQRDDRDCKEIYEDYLKTLAINKKRAEELEESKNIVEKNISDTEKEMYQFGQQVHRGENLKESISKLALAINNIQKFITDGVKPENIMYPSYIITEPDKRLYREGLEERIMIGFDLKIAEICPELVRIEIQGHAPTTETQLADIKHRLLTIAERIKNIKVNKFFSRTKNGLCVSSIITVYMWLINQQRLDNRLFGSKDYGSYRPAWEVAQVDTSKDTYYLYYLIIMSLLSAIDWNCLADDSRHILNTLKGYVVDLFKEASVVDKITDGIKKKLNDPTMYRLMQALNVPGFGDSYMCSDYDLSRITTSDASISSASASAINIQLLDDNNITVTSPLVGAPSAAPSAAIGAHSPAILVPTNNGLLTKISNEDGKVSVFTKVGLSVCGIVVGVLTTAHEFGLGFGQPMSQSTMGEFSQAESVFSDITEGEGPTITIDELLQLSQEQKESSQQVESQDEYYSIGTSKSVHTVNSVISNGVKTIVVDTSSPIEIPADAVDATVNAVVGFNPSPLSQMSDIDFDLLTKAGNKKLPEIEENVVLGKRERDEEGEENTVKRVRGGRSKTRKIRKYKTMRYASSSKSRKLRKGKKARKVTKRKQPKRKTMRLHKK